MVFSPPALWYVVETLINPAGDQGQHLRLCVLCKAGKDPQVVGHVATHEIPCPLVKILAIQRKHFSLLDYDCTSVVGPCCNNVFGHCFWYLLGIANIMHILYEPSKAWRRVWWIIYRQDMAGPTIWMRKQSIKLHCLDTNRSLRMAPTYCHRYPNLATPQSPQAGQWALFVVLQILSHTSAELHRKAGSVRNKTGIKQ